MMPHWNAIVMMPSIIQFELEYNKKRFHLCSSGSISFDQYLLWELKDEIPNIDHHGIPNEDRESEVIPSPAMVTPYCSIL